MSKSVPMAAEISNMLNSNSEQVTLEPMTRNTNYSKLVEVAKTANVTTSYKLKISLLKSITRSKECDGQCYL